MSDFTIRKAEKEDIPLILSFIKKLAVYEKMADQVVATEERLNDWLFNKKIAKVVFAVEDGLEVGFALYFHNFSTFLGRAGIYLEDLFIDVEYRGKGYGKKMLAYLAKECIDSGCGRLEWCCLDWNAPSIEFYLNLGAEQMNGWTIYRLTGDKLKNLAKE